VTASHQALDHIIAHAAQTNHAKLHNESPGNRNEVSNPEISTRSVTGKQSLGDFGECDDCTADLPEIDVSLNIRRAGRLTLHLAEEHALAQIDAVFDESLHAAKHLRPAFAVEIGAAPAGIVFAPAGLGIVSVPRHVQGAVRVQVADPKTNELLLRALREAAA
jgi:hypothetical protein